MNHRLGFDDLRGNSYCSGPFWQVPIDYRTSSENHRGSNCDALDDRSTRSQVASLLDLYIPGDMNPRGDRCEILYDCVVTNRAV